jgi:pyruvate/2-oxoglutarate dehydrogenase complex dihydrolipoamide acyltransferase (E2) component
MDRIGKYKVKPFSKFRRNIELIIHEGWKKHSIHGIIELDVTEAKKLIKTNAEKTGEKLSFTGWMIKCVAQSISEHKDLNSYRKGRNKLIVFDDVDIPIPVEREINGEKIPMAYILRKANEKTLKQITKEIREVQKQPVDGSKQLLGSDFTPLERFVFVAPMFIKKLLVFILRRNAIIKKKHMGTIGVTAIGMKGKYPGWAIPLGGATNILIVLGGITKKPGVINDKIEIRQYLHLTITADHDIIDGSPLARWVERLIELCEQGYSIPR